MLKGEKEFLNNLTLTTTQLELLGVSLFEQGREIVEQGREIAPIKYGNLRASGDTLDPRVSPEGVEVEMKFGGQAGTGQAFPRPDVLPQGEVDYAIFASEAARDPSRRQFLSQALLLNVSTYFKRMGASVGTVLRKTIRVSR